MKITAQLLIAGLTIFALVAGSCSKDGETGPIGPMGPQGEQGPQGEKGETGEDGNANVQSYDLIVKKADWSNNFHYGGNNVYRNYEIPADSTGGIAVRDFYLAGNVVLSYARLLNGETYQTEFLNVKQLPLLTTVSIDATMVGIRIELSPTRSEFLLSQTTNGFDSLSIPDEQVPPTVEFRIVFIEASNEISGQSGKDIFSLLKTAGVNISDYEAVMDYFKLEY